MMDCDLAREYHHRAKNALAVSAALVTLSARDAESVTDLVSKTRGRLTALASAHDSLISSSDHVDLEELTQCLFQRYVAADARADIAGPPVVLRNHQSTPMVSDPSRIGDQLDKIWGLRQSWKYFGSLEIYEQRSDFIDVE